MPYLKFYEWWQKRIDDTFPSLVWWKGKKRRLVHFSLLLLTNDCQNNQSSRHTRDAKGIIFRTCIHIQNWREVARQKCFCRKFIKQAIEEVSHTPFAGLARDSVAKAFRLVTGLRKKKPIVNMAFAPGV